MKSDSFIDLLNNRFFRTAIGRVKSPVVAEGAATGSLCTVAVRTGETSIYRHFLHSGAMGRSETVGEGVEPSRSTPGINTRYSVAFFHSGSDYPVNIHIPDISSCNIITHFRKEPAVIPDLAGMAAVLLTKLEVDQICLSIPYDDTIRPSGP